jgi:hypothetical protein
MIMNYVNAGGGKLKAKLKKLAPKPPMAKKIAEKKNAKKVDDPALHASIAKLKESTNMVASKLNDAEYKLMYKHWVANTGKDQGFDAWMAEAHQVYSSKPRKAGFDQWLANAVEAKVLSADGEVVTPQTVSAAAAPSKKTILGMKPSVAVPVFVAAGLLVGLGIYKYFKK